MKNINLIKIGIFIFTLAAASYVVASPNLTIGTKITEQDMSKIPGTKVTIGHESLKVITDTNSINKITRSSSTPSSSNTFIINNQGVIGSSQNIVVISEIPTMQVKSIAKDIITSTVSTQYYDHLNVSTLQFKNFNQAVVAYNQLIKLLPNASVTIPIQFNKPRPK